MKSLLESVTITIARSNASRIAWKGGHVWPKTYECVTWQAVKLASRDGKGSVLSSEEMMFFESFHPYLLKMAG